MDSGKLQHAKKWVNEYLNGRDPAEMESLQYVEAICKRVFTDSEAADMGGWSRLMVRVMLGESDPEAHKVTAYDVKRILNQYALLHTGGHGRSHDMRGLNGAEFWAKVAELRAAMLTEDAIKRIQTAYNWVRTQLRIGCRINRNRTSYGLKHVMEDDCSVYVTNGEFIIAMCLAGFTMTTLEYNPSFNVTESSVKALRHRVGVKMTV